MYKLSSIFILFIICLSLVSYCQTDKRQLNAQRFSEEPEIDGLETDEIWQTVTGYTDFTQYEPYNGAQPNQKSEIRLGYTDNAFFVLAQLFDSHPDSIIKGLTKRDDVSNSHTDAFGISIDPFNDGIYAFIFVVSVKGVQEDKRIYSDDEDIQWDAVWLSKTSLNEKGWVVEMKIPFSAIRLPKNEKQSWGINAWRYIRREREWSTLNFIDQEKHGVINQSATLAGISDIKPPLRLSLYPYVSTYLEKHPEQSGLSYSLNYGADLKYGINESFTLDLTLIPDFGQVQSDEEILNLSPFEVRYDENRQFFTEGTELFNKGGIFYSRRIGGSPVGYYAVYDQLKDGETVKSNPDRTNLINAVKVSGRTRNGLGIGAFNAMISAANAIIEDSSGNERLLETQGFTNYNVLVFDQTLKNNSFVSLINTHTKRKDFFADVGGAVFSLRNKKNEYSIYGGCLYSHRFQKNMTPETGFGYELGIGKTSGNFRFSIEQSVLSDNYNPNDLGYLQVNNSIHHGLNLNYNIYKPFWRVHFLYNSFWIGQQMLYNPTEFSSFGIYIGSRTRFRNHLSAGIDMDGTPVNSVDFYESRIAGLKYVKPPYIRLSAWISPDYRKPLAIDINATYRYTWLYQMKAYSIRIAPRIRLGDQLLLIISSSYFKLLNDRGYATLLADSSEGYISIFGQRDNMTLTNSINLDYIFNNKSSLFFRLRHYWSTADYHTYYELQNDGSLKTSLYAENHDINYNAFTIDMGYVWQFAPGSELSVVWKNAIFTQENQILPSYTEDLREVFNTAATNSISIKLLYYLDYQYLAKKNKN